MTGVQTCALPIYQFEFRPRRHAGFERQHRLGEAGLGNTVDHRAEPLGPLRVAGASKVFEIRGVSGEQHGHVR